MANEEMGDSKPSSYTSLLGQIGFSQVTQYILDNSQANPGKKVCLRKFAPGVPQLSYNSEVTCYSKYIQ